MAKSSKLLSLSAEEIAQELAELYQQQQIENKFNNLPPIRKCAEVLIGDKLFQRALEALPKIKRFRVTLIEERTIDVLAVDEKAARREAQTRSSNSTTLTFKVKETP